MGEGGMIGAPAAVLNAINDALPGEAAGFDHIPVLPEDVSAALSSMITDDPLRIAQAIVRDHEERAGEGAA
jgi:CO/xanthine dehydrogenase Mo-binding subunit